MFLRKRIIGNAVEELYEEFLFSFLHDGLLSITLQSPTQPEGVCAAFKILVEPEDLYWIGEDKVPGARCKAESGIC